MSSREVRVLAESLGPEGNSYLFGDFTKIAALFSGVQELNTDDVVDITFNRSGSSVRRYPGDPAPYTRGGSSVVKSLIPRPFAQTTPGRPFTVETPADLSTLPPGSRRTVRQFTLLTSWSAFHVFAMANAKTAMIIRSPGGVPAVIPDASP